MKKLTPQEALRALADGKKIKHKYWFSDEYVYLDDDGVVNQKGQAFSSMKYCDFMIYSGPKPKITLWRRPIFVTSNHHYRDADWFKSKEDFDCYYCNHSTLGEWESKEVEFSE